MNERIFEFIDTEMAAATDAARMKKLRAIKGYLQAAKDLRASYDKYGSGGYSCLDERRAHQFDVDCDRVAF